MNLLASLCPWFLEGVSKPLEFLGCKNIFVLHGGPLDNFRAGTGHTRKIDHMIREFEF